MTILVVVRKGNKACIAADTQISQGNIILPGESQRTTTRGKIIKTKDSFIGISGSTAHKRVFESIVKKHGDKLNFEGVDNIFETFRVLHPTLKEEYYLLPKEEEDQPYESNQIRGVICNHTGIFDFDSYREIAELSEYWAIGSGSQVALGALHATYELMDDVECIANAAVKAACKLDNGCGLPIESYSLSLTDRKSNFSNSLGANGGD